MSIDTAHSWPKLTSQDEFRFLVDLVLKHATGDHTIIGLHDQHDGTTRFANNQIIQNINTRKVTLTITSAIGRRHGTTSTTDLTAGSVKETLKRAEKIARISPEDSEYLPPVGPQTYHPWPSSSHETVNAGPERRLMLAREVIDQAQSEHLKAAGIVASSTTNVGVAANTGLFAHEQRTNARFSLTAQNSGATGWSSALHRSIEHLNIRERTHIAIQKAKRGIHAKKIPAGRYTVILEPPAAAGLLTWLIRMLNAKSYDKGTSAFSGKLDSLILDQRLTLQNRPDHPDLLGQGFTQEGLPVNQVTWIDKGVLKQLDYDRFTADQHRIHTLPTLEAPHLTGENPTASDVDNLIRNTESGVLVTNFWYIRPVNPTDLTLTGMTRDGTFLIEEGRITTPIHNFRFHDSPLRAFNHIESLTLPQEATSSETGKFLIPALKINDFHFSSVTQF